MSDILCCVCVLSLKIAEATMKMGNFTLIKSSLKKQIESELWNYKNRIIRCIDA